MKLAVLFLEYPNGKYPAAFEHFKKYINLIKVHDKEIIIIDNKMTESYFERIDKNTVRINGDNSLWEWSGWQAGIRYLKENNIEYDAILFANDAFMAPSGANDWLYIFDDLRIYHCIENNTPLGTLCNACCRYSNVNGTIIEDYFRTNCFIIPKKIMDKLRTVWSLDLDFLNECIEIKPSFPYFKDNAPLSNYTKHAMLKNYTEYWHSAKQPDDDWELFRMKILALFNEQFLTARIRDL